MNFPKNIVINEDIVLEIFSLSHKNPYFQAIHEIVEEDDFRVELQRRFLNSAKVELMLKDAIENKLGSNGSPDYFIFYKGELAGMFEFHPLNDDDYIEMGYWLFKKFRRKGILSVAIPPMIEFSKKYFDKSKILATTPIDNLASIGLLKKMKFEKTGKILEFSDQRTGVVSKEFEYFYYLN